MKILIWLVLFFQGYHTKANSLTATYRVPTEDQLLKKYASYDVSYVELSSTHLSFDTPKVFASPDYNRLEFIRSSDRPNHFFGLFGQAQCLSESQKKIVCNIIYNFLYKDYLQKRLDQTLNHIGQMDFDAEKEFALKYLAQQFAGDPIGELLIHSHH